MSFILIFKIIIFQRWNCFFGHFGIESILTCLCFLPVKNWTATVASFHSYRGDHFIKYAFPSTSAVNRTWSWFSCIKTVCTLSIPFHAW